MSAEEASHYRALKQTALASLHRSPAAREEHEGATPIASRGPKGDPESYAVHVRGLTGKVIETPNLRYPVQMPFPKRETWTISIVLFDF
jgi:hypothetical protein